MSEDSRKFTSFVIPGGQFEFLRTPFGLSNAPATFQRFINKIFEDLIKAGTVLSYMDDLIIPAESCEEGLKKLKQVLNRAADYGLEIKWSKCQFLTNEIEYLGHPS